MEEEVKTEQTTMDFMKDEPKEDQVEREEFKKAFEIRYEDDERISLVSTGAEVQLTTEQMYDEIILLAEMVKNQRIGEEVFRSAYRGTERYFADMARLKQTLDAKKEEENKQE